MNKKQNKGGRNPKADPATNRYSVNFNSQEHMRFLKMYDRSGMTSKSSFIKAQFFGETFHVVTFDKGLHEYYTKLSDFHAQFRMVGNNYNQTLKELRSHFFRAQGNGTDLQTGEVHAAVSRDCYEDCGTYKRVSAEMVAKISFGNSLFGAEH